MESDQWVSSKVMSSHIKRNSCSRLEPSHRPVTECPRWEVVWTRWSLADSRADPNAPQAQTSGLSEWKVLWRGTWAGEKGAPTSFTQLQLIAWECGSSEARSLGFSREDRLLAFFIWTLPTFQYCGSQVKPSVPTVLAMACHFDPSIPVFSGLCGLSPSSRG